LNENRQFTVHTTLRVRKAEDKARHSNEQHKKTIQFFLNFWGNNDCLFTYFMLPSRRPNSQTSRLSARHNITARAQNTT